MRLYELVALVGMTLFAGKALAEPPTHVIAFRGVTNKNNCIVQGKIVNVSHKKSEPFKLSMSFLGHPGVETGNLSSLYFNIPKLDNWETASIQDVVYGMICPKIHIQAASGTYSNFSPEIWKLRVLMSSQLDVKVEYVFIENPTTK